MPLSLAYELSSAFGFARVDRRAPELLASHAAVVPPRQAALR